MESKNKLSLRIPQCGSLSFYRSLLHHPILTTFRDLMSTYQTEDTVVCQDLYFQLKAKLLAYSFKKNEAFQYAKTPWKDYIISEIVSNENPLTLLFERGIVSDKHPFYKSMETDIQILNDLYHFNWKQFLDQTGLDDNNIFDITIFFPMPPHDTIAAAFKTGDLSTVFHAINRYIRENGLGLFENNTSFKINLSGNLVSIPSRTYKTMDTIIGNDRQKNALITNTAAFIKHYTGLNVLLKGDMGTGKSTMVKALLETFKGTKLRMIEFKKEQIEKLPSIISQIKDRPYPFILFVDDLSFDDKESDFKLFKNILEGSLEDNPENVLIYANSNKRHLVSETQSERKDAVHAKDVMEEKLSLSSRFGLVLNFTAPDQKSYLEIVHQMAKDAGINLPKDTLDGRAIQWELRHLNRSGRTAEQFIEYLLIKQNNN